MLSSKDTKILEKILYDESENPQMPKFPITPVFRINIPGFSNVWLKDESKNNITGTVKDRMSWEIVMAYKDILLSKKEDKIKGPLPQISMISAGTAALAIQYQMRRYGLPNLKVLVDCKIGEENLEHLKKAGCIIYKTDFSKKCLTGEDILKLTKNESGFDITSNRAFFPTSRFYDWLSYEVFNQNPDYVFIPYGSGQIFENILNVNIMIVTSKEYEKRKDIFRIRHVKIFTGNIDILKKCNFMGATTYNPKTKAIKLYAPHHPFIEFPKERINLHIYRGHFGKETGVYLFEEKFLDKAIEFARKNGIEAEPSGLGGLALFLQMKDKISKDKKIIILNTGKTRMPKFDEEYKIF